MTTEQRLERLERENRWIKRIGAVAVAGAAAVFLIGQGKDTEPQDLEVLSLAAKKLTVKDKNGKQRAELDTFSGNSYLRLYDKAGRRRVTLFADFEGHSTLSIGAKAGNSKLHLAVDPSGTPIVRLQGEATSGGITLFVSPDGAAYVNLSGKDGRTRASLKTKADGTPSLSFFDKAGKVIWKAPKD